MGAKWQSKVRSHPSWTVFLFFRWGETAVRGQFAPKLDSFFLGGAKRPSEVNSPPTWGRNGRPGSDRPQAGLSFNLGGAKWPSEVSSPPTFGARSAEQGTELRPQVGLSFFLPWGLKTAVRGQFAPNLAGKMAVPRSDRPQVGRNGPCRRPRQFAPRGRNGPSRSRGQKRPSEVRTLPGGETVPVGGQFAPGGESAVRGQIAPSFPYWVGFSLNGPLEPSTVSVRTSLGRPYETSTSSLEGPYQTSTASLGGLKGKIIRQGKLFLFLSRSPRNLAGTSVEVRATFLAKKIPSNSSGVGARGDGAKWHPAGRFAPPRNFQSPNISEKRL